MENFHFLRYTHTHRHTHLRLLYNKDIYIYIYIFFKEASDSQVIPRIDLRELYAGTLQKSHRMFDFMRVL